MRLRRAKKCQYGVMSIVCGRDAVTKRRSAGGNKTWDVCQFHADVLDRVRERILADEKLLRRLEEAGHEQLPYHRP
jgi:hypothetical protein